VEAAVTNALAIPLLVTIFVAPACAPLASAGGEKRAATLEAAAPPRSAPKAGGDLAAPSTADGIFAKRISPLLMERCSPCHAQGGKMYARMPFDDEKTVRANPEGVLRRFKGDDRKLLAEWLASSPAAAPR
jgi:hypothetical protein